MDMDELYSALVVRHPYAYTPRHLREEVPTPPRLDWRRAVVLPGPAVITPRRLVVKRNKRNGLRLIGQFVWYWYLAICLSMGVLGWGHFLWTWTTGRTLVSSISIPITALIISPLVGVALMKAHVLLINRRRRKKALLGGRGPAV